MVTSGTHKLKVVDNLAVVAGKISAKAIRALHIGLGSNLPGRVARKMAPTVLSVLAKQAKNGCLAVTGTNGKSTTSGFISSILHQAGFKIVHNRQGANLITGITASLIEAAEWRGNLDCDYCLFEIDEATLPNVAAEVPLKAIVVTNLFRDQLDRFGELDTTARLINKGIDCNHTPAILNCDDPNVAQLATESDRIYYGVESDIEGAGCGDERSSTQYLELAYCPKCGHGYSYSRFYYGQLGHYSCPNCGNQRPAADVAAEDVVLSAHGSQFTLRLGANKFGVNLSLPGLFNVYNALAAAAMAYKLGIDGSVISSGLNNYITLFGRSEKITIGTTPIVIQLIKNPAGASQVIKAAAADANARLLIAINDNLADGRDISWLWDADFELLGNHNHKLVVSGKRAEDMAVRMKYAGVPNEQIEVITDLKKALAAAVKMTSDGQTLWILPTYTCLLSLQKILAATGKRLSGT
jgi:UDP-N-acetylmuramyl tripeptide synthase